MMTEKEIRARRLRSQRKMKRGKRPPTKLGEIVADASRQEAAELEPMSPALERMVDDGLKRWADDEPEPMSPELARLIEQSADTTDMPQTPHKTRQKRKRKREVKHQ
jgi:hypothetical protein